MKDEDEEKERRKTRHIDVPLGRKIRLERDARGLSRETLAQRLDVSTSTIQKYENGSGRIPAARLWQICNLLNVDVEGLFSGLPHHVAFEREGGLQEAGAAFVDDSQRSKRVTAITKAAAKLTDERLQIAEVLMKALKASAKSAL